MRAEIGPAPSDRPGSPFEGMFDGAWLVAADGRTVYINQAMARLLGSTQELMRDRRITDFLDDAAKTDLGGLLDRLRAPAAERLRLHRDDGTDLISLITGSPITSPDGVHLGTMLSVVDPAATNGLDAQVVQNQRLEAIGQFAAGIAHDFNNLLTSIMGFTELARRGLPPAHPVRADLDQAFASAERAAAITRKLLAFTRRQVLIPIDVDPAQVIADLVPILEPLMGDHRILLDFQPGHGWIRIDPTQLEQIVVNLAVNARDAMPGGGTVTIRVGNLPRPDFVRISVSDTGTGMDDVTRARIFEPFFTTKSAGRGTGLGLSTVFAIVTQCGGHIDVESVVGSGATFHVDLPFANAAFVRRRRRASGGPVARSGVVLLVERDDAVRNFAQRSLEGAGYTVLAVSAAAEALEASGRWGEAIDVLVTDLIMPGMHGPELASLLRAGRPGIGLVFTSGHAAGLEGGLGHGASGDFLPKPFSADALVKAASRAAGTGRQGAIGPPKTPLTVAGRSDHR